MKLLQTPVGLLRCWNADDLTRSLALGEFWDAHLKPTMDATPADGWAVDLGANIGFFTIYLAQRFERVLAVEAHPETAKLLIYNVGAAGVDHTVLTVSGAAYDRSGLVLELAASHIHRWPEGERSFLDMDSVPHSAGFSFVEDPSLQHHLHEVKVGTVCVDSLVPASAQVRLIKVDVQGAALRALQGAEGVIARCRPRILFEFEQHVSECRGDFWGDYTRFFDRLGYDVESIPGPWSDFLAVPR